MKQHRTLSVLTWIFSGLLLSGGVGCSMCCSQFDYDYQTFGGKHQRTERDYGRVGSVFSDPLAGYNGPSADANLEAAPEIEDQKGFDDQGEEDDLQDDRVEKGTLMSPFQQTVSKIQSFGRN